MYYALNDDKTLVFDQGEVALVDRQGPLRIPLSQVTALVLNFCDGTSSVDELTQLLVQVFAQEPDTARLVVEETLWRYVQFVTAHPERAPEPLRPQPLDPLLIFERVERERPWRAAAPGGLDWLATYQCNRRCVYCYRDAPLTAEVTDLYLTTADLYNLLDQGKAVGVRDFLVNGGEPFFRKDTIDVIDYAQRHGMWVKTYTKWHFSPEEAERLCRNGRPRVYFSVDTANPQTNLFLIGNRNYFDEAVDSIRNLVRAGAEVFITPVVTSHNLHELPDLIDRLAPIGAAGIRVAPFMQGLRRWRNDLDLSMDQWEELTRILEKYSHLLEDQVEVAKRRRGIDRMPTLPTEMKTGGCANGLTSLTIHPNGDAALCDKFVDERLVVGNIKRQSLMEIWNSPRMYELLLPSESLYAGTNCSGCGGFDGCNKRGRCYYSSLLRSGSIYGPDEDCGRDDFIPLNFICKT